MTNSPNPTPNPNRRRRLTADELIAIGVALAGIGTVFFWGIGQKYRPMDLFKGETASIGSDKGVRKIGLLGEDASSGQERRTIASAATKDRKESTTTTIASPVLPTVKTAEVPAAETPTPPVAATVPAPVVPVIAAAVSTAPVFTDIPKQFWGETYITELRKRGVLDDFGTGKFDPSKEITRGEYAKMLDRAFADKPVTAATASFKDIPTDYPRKEAVDKSVQLGFMTGYSPTKFAPNQVIPRYQLQISLAKGLKLPTSTSSDTVLGKFADAKQMPDYARGKMASAIDAGLIIKDKTADLLKPVQNATRADAAALIYEVLVKEGKITPQAQPQK
jgi:S-layer homology domain